MDAIIKQIETKTILTKSNLPIADYSINPYIGCTHACKYCYACFIKRFTKHQEDWGTFLDVKNWQAPKNLERYKGKEFFLGSSTDPYNPQEETFKRTQKILQELQGADIRLSIQTKSDLVLRDIDLIKSFKNVRVGFSINTLDENFKNDMDKAVSIERRLNAMQTLHNAGIMTVCFISPIFPGITNVFDIIGRVKNICNFIWLENLNLRGNFAYDIFAYIKQKYPHLQNLYYDIYGNKNKNYWQQLDAQVAEFAKTNCLDYLTNVDFWDRKISDPPLIVNFFYHEKIKKSAQLAQIKK